ncbi:MAG: hypothetical protein H0X34_02025 [Chthoniobacterales bacterium]|nr:hypothetical protein [Chthoniobacterales bacterium]
MKPQPPFARSGRGRFPLVDACFQSDLSDWRGSSWSGGGDDSPAHRFNKFNREFLRESRREHDREMLVLGVIMLIAAWPVFYMIYTVIRLLLHGNPLGL